jgi:outer membrane receptor protein involved in Fe transport
MFPITPRQSFTLGGHATWQSGANYDRTETVTPTNPTGEPLGLGIPIAFDPEGSEHVGSHWWLNLSGAYSFPIHKNVFGDFRLEVQNATDNQEQLSATGRGEARTIRRGWQRPRRYRALFGIRF